MQGIKMKRTDVIRMRDTMLKKQGGICPLCQQEIVEGQAVLDHSHVHGYIRAVLCRNCNAMEGKVRRFATQAKRHRTALEWLKSLVEYWIYHDTPKTKWIHHTFKSEAERKVAQAKRRTRITKAKARGIILARKRGSITTA